MSSRWWRWWQYMWTSTHHYKRTTDYAWIRSLCIYLHFQIEMVNKLSRIISIEWFVLALHCIALQWAEILLVRGVECLAPNFMRLHCNNPLQPFIMRRFTAITLQNQIGHHFLSAKKTSYSSDKCLYSLSVYQRYFYEEHNTQHRINPIKQLSKTQKNQRNTQTHHTLQRDSSKWFSSVITVHRIFGTSLVVFNCECDKLSVFSIYQLRELNREKYLRNWIWMSK